MSDTHIERWMAGLSGRHIEDTRIPDDLCTRVRLWAELSPHLPPDARGAWLIYREGGQPHAVAIGEGKIVGRGQDADIRIEYPWLSRRHFAIRPSADGHVLEDLGGKNPVSVNNQPELVRRLISGDAIRVGDMDFLFVVAADPAP